MALIQPPHKSIPQVEPLRRGNLRVVTCENCGYANQVYLPRMNHRGLGAYYSNEIKALQPTHLIVLQILRDNGAVDSRTGFTLPELWPKVADICRGLGRKIPSKQGLSGRLSELVGLKLCKKDSVEVEVYDQRTHGWRYRKTPVTFLAESDAHPHELLQQQELTV